ncbi:UNVERIFIED_CONTAM: hypothetical protein PYX00_003169 [Menopon gallinae]|uniref:Major facilitator superfamily (MFS) profile domain-containing protein n=1 Tax=Menopon gallinae TaxID=328185 RepID=A0AAW2HZP9_9NEOP
MMFDDILEQIGEGIFQRFAVAVCGMATLAEAIATACVPFAVLLASMLGLNSIFVVGSAIGGYWLGGVSDASGRKYILSTTSIITFIGCFVASFAQCVIMFYISLLILGLGIGGNHTATRLFISEITPKSCRGSRLVVLEIFFCVGYIIAIGLSCLLVPSTETGLGGSSVRLNSWRILFGLSGSLSIFSACLMSVFPASPRWLLGKKQEDEAIDVLRKIYAVNRMKHEESFPIVQLDPITYVNVRNESGMYQCSSHFIRTFRCIRIYTRQLFAKKYLKTTVASLAVSMLLFDSLVVTNVWLGLTVSSGELTNCTLHAGSPYYVTNLTDFCITVSSSSSFEVNVYLSLCSLTAVLMVFPVDKIHRKFILLGSSVIAGVSSIAFVFSPVQNVRLCFAFTVLSFLFVSEITFRIILLESYPTIFRGTAYGFVKLFARLFLTFLVVLLRVSCVWSFVSFGVLFILAGLTSSMLPNHNQEPMED